MSYALSSALQAAVYQALADDVALFAIVGDAIYDALPVGALPPMYVSLGPETVVDASDSTGVGAVHRFSVSVVSDTPAFAAVKVAAGVVSDVLHGADLTLSRGRLVLMTFERATAARIDGADFWMIFMRIILPLSIPIIVVSVIWQFTQIWNDFLFGVVYSSGDSQPITVALNNLVNTSTGVKEYNVDMAAAIIAALPTLFVYVVAGKYFVKGLTAGAVKG